jgi:hypothetical protein
LKLKNQEEQQIINYGKMVSSRYLRYFGKNGTTCNYIHYNPVEAEIVFHERDYVNSYRNYEEENTVFCNVNVEPLW